MKDGHVRSSGELGACFGHVDRGTRRRAPSVQCWSPMTRAWAALRDCRGAQALLATVDATFWLPLKKLSGSYFALMATSRSKFTP